MNLARAIGVGALGLLAIGGWKVLNAFANKKKLPSKEQTLDILETVRQEFYPILVQIADLVTSQLAPRGLTPEENEKIVMLDPQIKAEIERINQKIYSTFTESEVKEAIEKLYREDGDIIHQKTQFKEEYKKSLMGVRPERRMTISRKIKKEKVLQAIEAILQDKLDRLETQIGDKLKQQEIRAFLERDVEEDERVTKEVIKQKLGLCAKDAIKIFHFVVVEYKKDEHFNASYQALMKRYAQKTKNLCEV